MPQIGRLFAGGQNRIACIWHGVFLGLFGLSLAFSFSGCTVLTPRAQMDQEVRARMDLASSYSANEQPRLALRQLQALQGPADNHPDYHFLYGLTWSKLQRHEQACEHFRKAVSLRPEFAQAWNNLGQSYAALDQAEKAEQAFRQALDIPTYLTPEFAAYNLSRLYKDQGQTEEAKGLARQSLDANPEFVPAMILFSELLTADNRIQEAVDIVSRGLQAQPNDVRLMQDLAENLLRLGRQKQARQWFERIAKTADPQSEAAQVAADYLELLPQWELWPSLEWTPTPCFGHKPLDL
ncbi:MAG: tetratricopeptide repeat protein [Desulfovermiculus sp.]|nr:tetratricopeptide repeat protein [Desulfovermiculus sp.]